MRESSPAIQWQDLFPYAQPYDQQGTGINEAVQTLLENGIYLLEGPCGTGKTLLSLTATLSLVRDRRTPFQRVLAVTPKKQQIRAFEADLEAICDTDAGRGFEGITLVGKADVCPYVQDGVIDADNIYHRCVKLRDGTKRLRRNAVENGRAEDQAVAAYGLTEKAREMQAAQSTPSQSTGPDSALDVSPYQATVPETNGEEFCPFYAQSFIEDRLDEQSVEIGDGMTAHETLYNGAREGVCPHMAMKQLTDSADVVIGNFKHAFSPRTVEAATGDLIDTSTLLIVDEAHELVSTARDELSQSVQLEAFDAAVNDIDIVLRWLTGRGDFAKQEVAQGIQERGDFTIQELRGLRTFVSDARDRLVNAISEHLADEYGRDWKSAVSAGTVDELSIPLQSAETDALEQWALENGYEDVWIQALYLAHVVAHIRESAIRKVDLETPEGQFPIMKVRELLHRWFIGDQIEYYREAVLSPQRGGSASADGGWQSMFDARLELHNCIPQDELAATLDAFGGVILQSATLEPIDVYSDVIGVNKLEYGAQPSSSLVTKAAARYRNDSSGSQASTDTDGPPPEERSRNVTRSAFQTTFPEDNRLSLTVTAPKFTYSNRWPPDNHPETRATYTDIITTTAAETPGNVLIFMPSYKEAEWAGEQLKQQTGVSKPVLVDESSSDKATERLKSTFYSGDGKVLVTTLRGTLTEGVDFAGDKLRAAVVCGVPIANTQSDLASAIQDAYADRFGEGNAFDYAFTIPAIRKARQAYGRVIRGADDVGVRILADERYAMTGRQGYQHLLPDHVQAEFEPTAPQDLRDRLRTFWHSR